MEVCERHGAALTVEDLEKVYADGTRALGGFSLQIPVGSFFGLLGPNGSGKSTLIGIISGLVRAPAGHVFVFGHDAVAQAPQAFTSSTSFANPAISVGRIFSDTFAGIAPSSVPAFILAQLAGGLAAVLVIRALYPDLGPASAAEAVLPHAQPETP